MLLWIFLHMSPGKLVCEFLLAPHLCVKLLHCGVYTCSIWLLACSYHQCPGLPIFLYLYAISYQYLILSDFKIFSHPVRVNGISLWFHYAFSWLLMSFSPYVMAVHLAPSIKCCFIYLPMDCLSLLGLVVFFLMA